MTHAIATVLSLVTCQVGSVSILDKNVFLATGVALHRVADTPACETHGDCADLDGDFVRDDVCVWWECVDGECVGTDVVFGDMAGQGGHCPVDGTADGNDFNYGVMGCIRNWDWHKVGEYTCEEEAPRAYRLDIGRRGLACVPDGVCDANDRYLGQYVFDGLASCTCPLDAADPAPLPAATGGLSGARLFMAPDGSQNGVPTTGNTAMVMEPGETRRVMVWLEDKQPGEMMTGYQLMLENEAVPLGDAEGTVAYAEAPSWFFNIEVDTSRADWVYASTTAVPVVNYTEAAFLSTFGVFYGTAIPLDDVDPANGAIHYLAEFDLVASPDAFGAFELTFVRDAIDGFPRPLTDVFQPSGFVYPIDEVQSMTVFVGGQCASYIDCADADGNGLRDDVCVWWACEEQLCESLAVIFGDMAGSFGACMPDGTADSHDRFAALACFANQNPDGSVPYDCDPGGPAALNVDTGGGFGTCTPDGVCDGNDAYHALNVFAGVSSCMSTCDNGPAPVVEELPPSPQRAALSLCPDRTLVRQGETVAVQVVLGSSLDDLRGYQLHLGTSGGTRGHLHLVDISIDRRKDALFANDDPWFAFNVSTQQMTAGLDTSILQTPADAYLATFTFSASRDAIGRFTIELLADPADRSERTFLFHTDPRVVTDIKAEPAIVEVVPERKRSVRR